MLEVILKLRSKDGVTDIPVSDGRTTFGRGGEVTHQLFEEGLSRLHASVFREGDRVWIVDEMSTNGTLVNGEPAAPRGTPLVDGDEISFGGRVSLTVCIGGPRPDTVTPASTVAAPPNSTDYSHLFVPVAVTLLALFIVAAATLFIGVSMYRAAERTPEFQASPDDEEDTLKSERVNREEDSPTPQPSGPLPNTTIEAGDQAARLPEGLFQNMSEVDRDRYIAARAEKIARIIGNQKSDPIPPAAVASIKQYVSGYVRRLKSPKKDSCEKGWGASDFVSVLSRATRTGPMVIRHFRAEGIEPQIGIYVAMIEGEHCPCLTSPTGAQGMFQFLASSAPDYGLDPARRCEPEESAKAGAKYLKSLIARYGTAPDSVPLAIASFNSGQGNLSKNLDKVLAQAVGQDRSFWTLVANKDILEGRSGEQFKNENIAYIPKFFAAAIIGEHPADFGIQLQPLSTYAN